MRGGNSHIVDRYLARGFLLTFLVVLAVVVILLQSLDLMNEADAVLAAEGAGTPQLLRYVGWRAPQLVDRFGPFVALLAALIIFARLAQSSEIIAMRASGLSPLRVIAPLCVTGAVIACLHFAFHELVVVEANARLERWRSQDYAAFSAAEAQPIANIRMNDGRRIVRADSLSRDDGNGDGFWRLENVRAYLMDDSGLVSALRAGAATHDGVQWRLERAQIYETEVGQWRAADGRWPDGPAPDTIVAAALDPEMASLPELARATGAAEGLGGGARLETALLHRFSAPAASLIMPLLAAIAGFGLHRRNTLLPRIAAGLGLGFAYFVLDNVMVVTGRLDAAPAVVAAFAAPLVFLGVGLAIKK